MTPILRISAAAALLALAGCASTDADQERFRQIADKLESGGSCYFINSTRHSGPALKKHIRQSEKKLWDAIEIPDKKKFEFQHFISCGELLSDLMGIHEIKGWGGSSKKIPSTSENLFRNRFRVLFSAGKRGILWNLIRNRNTDLSPYLANLPADTFFAGAADLSPQVLNRLLATEKKVSEPVEKICKLFLDRTPEHLLSSLAGIWKIVIVCDEDNDPAILSGVHIALTLPDRGNRLFQDLSARFKNFPGSGISVTRDRIKFSRIPGKMCIPLIVKGKDSLTFYTNPNAEFRTSDGQSMPRLPEFIRKLSRHTRLEGAAVIYRHYGTSGINFSGAFKTSSGDGALAVLQADKAGFLVEEISPKDLGTAFLLSLAELPMKFFFDGLASAPAQQPQSPPPRTSGSRTAAPGKKAAVPPKAAPAVKSRCLHRIAFISKKITEYASKNKKWPAPGIAGLRSMTEGKVFSAAMLRCPDLKQRSQGNNGVNYANCHYLYFGPPAKKSPRTPVLMEFPFLHKEYFAVSYADGSVEKIRLDGHRNVRRAVSFLHTVHSYDEEEFMRLMQLAAEFDKILEL